jgi:UDP-3-O-[3-hydroxymyristoyl] glucosamine N-acyltransferase
MGRGTKIDGMCYVAHNVKIGSDVGISGATSLGGSVVIEDGAYIGSARIMNGLRIGKNAFVGYGSVVILDVKAGKKVFGNPAKAWSIE